MTDITPIVTALLTLIGAIITTLLIPYIRSKTTAAQREQIAAWVGIGVTAAEQLFKGTGRGEEKKAWVIEWLKQQNVTYDEVKINAMIEAAVYELPTVIVKGDEKSP